MENVLNVKRFFAMRLLKVNLFAISMFSCAAMCHAAEFFILPNTKTLLMMGETVPSDVEVLSTYIEKDGVDVLMLKGPGGSLEAGYIIAGLVLKHNLNTTVPAVTKCASACSLIFAAGNIRSMEDGSQLGFHLPFIDFLKIEPKFRKEAIGKFCASLTNNDDFIFLGMRPKYIATCLMQTYQSGLKDIRKLKRLLARDGISEKVLDLVIDTPPNNMVWLKADESRKLGLVNN